MNVVEDFEISMSIYMQMKIIKRFEEFEDFEKLEDFVTIVSD